MTATCCGSIAFVKYGESKIIVRNCMERYAETDAGNAASQRVLEKCGFRPNGILGEEGPRFTLDRPIDAAEGTR